MLHWVNGINKVIMDKIIIIIMDLHRSFYLDLIIVLNPELNRIFCWVNAAVLFLSIKESEQTKFSSALNK